ncbi:MAG: prepilin-type N-terminal cleavage/methylation domain-containing protein [Deltaproteobacteria bacterium]|nr:prepilin-type N-terminal cleavage/methylation domain-containing protein [Deltaproteobacteria bacterium]MBW2019202.1 prepilin-type N-terminal cleavage/methylation domain-containing protein [Deltaproteobacteria bacterium]MBW2074005.1 prepilin-type N-terminal cleavage/methylation domain-containing protein [Deltaproteobacteria bacterium]
MNGDRCETCRYSGFTLLEVMVAMAIIAIALTAVFGSQSQSLSLASETKFSSTAVFLAQHKMAEIEAEDLPDLTSDSGDFGKDFPGYHWDLSVNSVAFDEPQNISNHLKQIDLTVSWEENDRYKYRLRLYRFVPKTKK